MIAQQVLQKLLDYDIYTGKFTWIQARKDFIGTIAGCPATNGYIQIRVLGSKYPAHKLAFLWMEDVYPELVDHIDTNITNNSSSFATSVSASNFRITTLETTIDGGSF